MAIINAFLRNTSGDLHSTNSVIAFGIASWEDFLLLR